MARSRVQMTVKDTDKGWAALWAKIRRPGEAVTVGIHGDEDNRDDGGFGNVAMMATHEFGSKRAKIPERSVIRKTVDEQTPKWRRILNRLGGKIYLDGMTQTQALDIMGLKMASDMQRTITKQPGAWPALSDLTIARKSSSKKLIDTRELLRAFKHKVTGS